MGMPPNHVKNPPNGQRKVASLSMKYSLVLKAKATNNMMGRSQLEVCGAAIMTHLGMSGSRPSARHPKILRSSEADRRNAELITGVSKIVYCTLTVFPSLKQSSVDAFGHTATINGPGAPANLRKKISKSRETNHPSTLLENENEVERSGALFSLKTTDHYSLPVALLQFPVLALILGGFPIEMRSVSHARGALSQIRRRRLLELPLIACVCDNSSLSAALAPTESCSIL
jgi:hypothetical protein